MDFRVTPRLGIEFATSALARQAAELQRTQQQISTGIRLQRPSDDPSAVRRSIIQKDQLTRLETNVASVQQAQSRLSQAHVQLRNAQELLIQAREVALSAAQATEPAEYSVLAKELDGILNQLFSIANSSDETGFLFAGTATQSQPFTFDPTRPYGVASYSGTSANSELHVTGDVSRELLIAGDSIFGGTVREPSLIIGSTGVAGGQSSTTAIGYRKLTLTHTLTTFAAGSGIAAGASSAAGDTIVGAAGVHKLQIEDISGTGAFGTVSLNGGAPVNFTSTTTDLKVTGPSGEVVYVDTSALTAGFSGSVDITADGTISIDEGATSTPLTFDANESVVDSRDNSVVYLDTSGRLYAGQGVIEFPGTTDVFDTLVALRDDVLNERGLNTQNRLAAFDRHIANIDRIENHLLDQVGVQSVALEQLDKLQIRTEDQSLEQKIRYGETTSADLAAAAVKMQELLNQQQFTMAAVSRVLSQNLLQYLQ